MQPDWKWHEVILNTQQNPAAYNMPQPKYVEASKQTKYYEQTRIAVILVTKREDKCPTYF